MYSIIGQATSPVELVGVDERFEKSKSNGAIEDPGPGPPPPGPSENASLLSQGIQVSFDEDGLLYK